MVSIQVQIVMVVARFLLLVLSVSGNWVEHPAVAQDPCLTYKVLTNESRSIFKYSSQRYTDHGLNGWHRFIGKAGNGMLDYVPTVNPSTSGNYRCGATMLGYLSGGHPKKHEGIVPRTVCFYYGNSNCWTSTTIRVKNCGNYFVYKLSALPRAYFIRYCGNGEMKDLGNFSLYFNTYRTNAFRNPVQTFPVKVALRDWLYFEVNATVQNSSLALLIERCFATPTMNRNDPMKYDIIDQKCAVDSTTSFIPTTSLTRRFSMEAFRYENASKIYIHCLVSFCRKNSTDPRCRGGCMGNGIGRTNEGDVAPATDGRIDYAGPYTLSTGGLDVKRETICGGDSSGDKTGSILFHFNTYKTKDFKNPIQSFPVKLKLRDWLYFEVNATVQNSSLALIIERCYSTPTMNPEEPGRYDIVKDRCAVDASTSFIPATGLRRRFYLQVSKHFNTSTLYIHCIVFFCRKNSYASECRTGCSGNNIYSRKRRNFSAVSLTLVKFFKLSTGKFVFREKSSPSAHRTDTSFPTITLLFGGMVAFALILVIIVVALLIHRRAPPGSEERQHNEIGMQNVARECTDEPSVTKVKQSLNV